MAAGLGFKDFATGEVLTAADVDGYLMQGVWVFASAAARDAAVTSPQEGNFAYLKDTNVTTYYTGSAWANLDTTGMTNPMTTTGDTIYSSSGSTPARLGIGSTGNVLTVSGGVPVWAAPAGGGKLLQVVQGTTTTATTINTSTYTDTTLTATITPTLATSKILVLTSQIVYLYRTTAKAQAGVRLVRGATVIGNYASTISASMINAALAPSGETELTTWVNLNYLDNPATTSATTYKTQMASATNQLGAQQDGITATITLLEIGA
jgi:hypothetical protein